MRAKIYVGTSGYIYGSWEKGVFYPPGLKSEDKLRFYASRFNTVELNSPFYRVPRASTFEKWSKAVPDGFLFAVKVNRTITHYKKLIDVEKETADFLEKSSKLGRALGPFLFQFPPSFAKDIELMGRFLELLPQDHLYAFEFRHKTWFEKDALDLFRSKNMAICCADSSRFPVCYELTADFAYIRFHGRGALYASCYTTEELKEWAQRIREYSEKCKEVYCYFNNDFQGYAVQNALELKNILGQ